MLLCWVPGRSFFVLVCAVCDLSFVLTKFKEQEALSLREMRENSRYRLSLLKVGWSSTCNSFGCLPFCRRCEVQGWMLMGCSITSNIFGERLALGAWMWPSSTYTKESLFIIVEMTWNYMIQLFLDFNLF